MVVRIALFFMIGLATACISTPPGSPAASDDAGVDAHASDAESTPDLPDFPDVRQARDSSDCVDCEPHSCLEVLQRDPDATDGEYEIRGELGELQMVTCDMTNGGWTLAGRVEPETSGCPAGWDLHPSMPGCGRGESDDPRRIADFVAPHRFTEVRGRATGLQSGTVDAFNSGGDSEDTGYVDGLGIFATGNGRAEHVWTYVAAFSENADALQQPTCPCVGGRAAPAFVGEDYFCESGYPGNGAEWPTGWYPADPLWDEPECHAVASPYFEKSLLSHVADLEARLMLDSSRGDEDLLVTSLELWVRDSL